MHLEKDTVALERPGLVPCAIFVLYFPACGLGALCIPRILLLIELFKRPALLLASVFTRSSLESSNTSPFPNLTSCLSKPVWLPQFWQTDLNSGGGWWRNDALRKWKSVLWRVGLGFLFLHQEGEKLCFAWQACFWLMCLPETWIFPQAQSFLNRECYRRVLHNHQRSS